MQSPFPSLDFIREQLASINRRLQHRDGFRRAAVLLPLIPVSGDWEILLTRRNSDLPHHRGQIAFPGGSVDEGENCMQTALREAHEEIGLDESRVEVLGCHDDIWTPTGFVISPVVGVLPDAEGLQPNPAEVTRLFTVPLSFFADDTTVQRQFIRHEGVNREVFFYPWDGETIWGATALMIRNFLTLLGMIGDVPKPIS
ncbi:MAG: CoA pyrophosphatase [Bacteroidetes bacterium]|nr:CoA pyrophosphatase [Bacteroidota bacterium]